MQKTHREIAQHTRFLYAGLCEQGSGPQPARSTRRRAKPTKPTCKRHRPGFQSSSPRDVSRTWRPWKLTSPQQSEGIPGSAASSVPCSQDPAASASGSCGARCEASPCPFPTACGCALHGPANSRNPSYQKFHLGATIAQDFRVQGLI